jgi:hypothetical protein
MEKMMKCSAGLDVHRDTVVASIRGLHRKKERVETRTFETYPRRREADAGVGASSPHPRRSSRNRPPRVRVPSSRDVLAAGGLRHPHGGMPHRLLNS